MYVGKTSITSITPNVGSTAGGSRLTIYGSGKNVICTKNFWLVQQNNISILFILHVIVNSIMICTVIKLSYLIGTLGFSRDQFSYDVPSRGNIVYLSSDRSLLPCDVISYLSNSGKITCDTR